MGAHPRAFASIDLEIFEGRNWTNRLPRAGADSIQALRSGLKWVYRAHAMTEIGDQGPVEVLSRSASGVRLARVCCGLVVLSIIASIVYAGVIVLENYSRISV